MSTFSMAAFAAHDGDEGRRLPALQKGPHWVTWPNPFTNLDSAPGKSETLPAVVAQWTARPIDKQRMDSLSRPKITTPRKVESGFPRPKPTYFHVVSDRDINNRVASAPSAESWASPAPLAGENGSVKPKGSPRKLKSIDNHITRKGPKMAWMNEETKNKDEDTKGREAKGAIALDTPPTHPSAQSKAPSPRRLKQPAVRGAVGKSAHLGRIPQKSNSANRSAATPVSLRKTPDGTQNASRAAPKFESTGSPKERCLAPKEPPARIDLRQNTAWQESAEHDIAPPQVEAEFTKGEQAEYNDDEEDDNESDASGSYFERIMAREEEMELSEKQIPSLRRSHDKVRKSVEFRRASRKSFQALNPQLGPWVRQMLEFVTRSQNYISGDIGYIFDVSRATLLDKMLPTFRQSTWQLQNKVIFERPSAQQNMDHFRSTLFCWVTQMVNAVTTSFSRFSHRDCDGDERSEDSVSSLNSWNPEDIEEESLYDLMVRDPKRASVLQRELPSLRKSIEQIRRSSKERRHSELSLLHLHGSLREWVQSMTNECITNFMFAKKSELGIIFDTARRVEIEKLLPCFGPIAKNMRVSHMVMEEQNKYDLREWVRHMLSTLTYKDDRTRRNECLGAAEVARSSN